jgi:endogenous inhibitor of DNA gyrase (YacG/DUF329 family)
MRKTRDPAPLPPPEASAESRPCPICGSPVTARSRAESREWPFCSPRCKLIDLGRWLSGEYRIPGRPADPERELPESDPT